MNKKGGIIGMVFFVGLLLIVLFVGFIMIIGSSVFNLIGDTVTPELQDLGIIADANFTQIADITIVPLNTLIQNFTWMAGVLYFLMLIGSFGFAVSSRLRPDNWLMGFYFILVILLIAGAILISNIYEDIINTPDEFTTIMKEHTILNYMILYSPSIFTVVAFITGIIMFAGKEEELNG